MRNRIVFLAITGAGALSLLYGQGVKSVWDGVYSPEQAARGAALYQKQCASCHGADLAGAGQAPGLADEEFRKEWNGQTVGDLFERMRTSMPADHPGSLSLEQNADLMAFILKTNGFPAGKDALTGEAPVLDKIKFTAKK